MNKFLVLSLVLMLGLALIGQAYAGSQSNIVKSIKKDAGDFKKVCEVWLKNVNNKELHKVYVKKNSLKCDNVVVPTINQPPVLKVNSPVKCIINLDCTLTIEQVKDVDGNITAIIWNQESGNSVNLTVSEAKLSAVFVPPVNDTYVFSVEARDNNGSSTLKPIVANVGVNECPKGTHLENGVCVPDVIVPAENTTNIILVGDLSGTSVISAAVKANPELFVALGDIFYGNDLSKYNTLVKSVFSDSRCVIGNHDSDEDGIGAIIQQAIDICGSGVWVVELPHTLLVGFNSNGDIPSIINTVESINYTQYDNVVIVSHKPSFTSPNSHHPVSQAPDVKKVSDAIASSAVGKNIIDISAHNHQMAGTLDGSKFVSGAGGRSHYVCNTDATWIFCNNQKYGYLELIIDNDSGHIKKQFVDTSGQVLKSWD